MRKMVLLRRSGVGAVSAGGESGGAVGGLCFGVLRVGDERQSAGRSWHDRFTPGPEAQLARANSPAVPSLLRS